MTNTFHSANDTVLSVGRYLTQKNKTHTFMGVGLYYLLSFRTLYRVSLVESKVAAREGSHLD